MAGSDSDIGKIVEAAALAREEELRELRAQQRELRAQPFSLPPLSKVFVQSFEEVHGKFLSPIELIKSLNLSTQELAVTQIHREMKSGRIKGLCEEAHVAVGDVLDRPKWVELDPWIWKLSSPSADADFWETGYFHIEVPATAGRTGSQGSFELFGVRFGWARTRSEPEAQADEVQSQQQTPLPKAEAERVAKAILEVWTGTVTETRAVELARGMCPDHKVSRDPFLEIFRAIRGNKKPGKPASNGK